MLFVILIIIFSTILALIVLVQNPKGGGIAGSLGGFSNQLIGVRQSTDIMEKGTWLFATLIAILCIASPVFIKGSGSGKPSVIDNAPATLPKGTATPQNNSVTMPGTQQTPVAPAADSNKK